MQSSLKTISLLLFFLLACSTLSLAQTRSSELQRDVRPRNCSISGRVTINGQPAANVQVQFLEFPTEPNAPQPIRQTADGSISRNTHKARTDGEGRYQITNLPPGRFVVTAASKAFVVATANPQNNEPKMVTLDAGESRENVDFALVRGGVITGQVTDAEGRPVIAHHVRLSHIVVTPDGQSHLQNRGGLLNSQITDDRGVYRIYGIPAGNYAISVEGENRYFRDSYPQIFYPGTPDEKQAKAIPVKAGEEVTGINFRLGVKRKTYEAIGRVIESDSGKPVPNIRVSCQKIHEEGSEDNEGGYGDGQVDQQGNFRLTGLNRGKYSCRVHAGWMEATDFYTEPTTFQVRDEDVSGIEIKALRGGTVSGVSIIEGSNDAATKAKLSRIMIYASAVPEERQEDHTQPSSHHQTTLRPDGTFLLTGVAPGKVTLHVNSLGDRSMSLIRIEQGGAPIEESFKLAKGEKITDVRLIFAVGTGAIRGQVQPTSRPQTVGETYRIQARLQGNKTGVWFNNLVDDKGRFELTSLPAGEYELQLNGVVQLPDGSRRMIVLAKQKISVPVGSTVTVAIPYDPNRPFQEER